MALYWSLIRTTVVGVVGFALGACSANPDGSFADVQRTIAARSSGKRLRWMRSPEEDARTQTEVAALLRRPLSADGAAQVALLNNRGVQAELEEIGIAQADYLQALLPGNPTLSGSVRFPNRPPSAANVEGQLVVSIFDLFLLPVRRKIAAAELEAAKLRVAGEVLNVVADTKAAVYTLQARQQLASRLELIVKTNAAALDIAQRRRAAGNATDLELVNQQALYSQSKVDFAKAQIQVRSDREQLNRLMGLWGRNLGWRVASQLPSLPASEGSSSRLEARAIAGRLDLALARQNVASLAQALRLKGSTRLLPTGVNVGINRERETDRTTLTGPTLEMRLPLFDFGQASIPKLEAQYRQAVHELEALAVNARSEVREARALVLAQREMTNFHRTTLLPQRLQILNQTALFYNAMQLGPIELLAAKERELQAERGYIDAWRDYWVAKVALERSLVGRVGAISRRGARMGETPNYPSSSNPPAGGSRPAGGADES